MFLKCELLFISKYKRKNMLRNTELQRGDLYVFPREILAEIVFFLTPSEQLMLSFTCIYFFEFINESIKKHFKPHITPLKPIGYNFCYGGLLFYFSSNDNTTDFANIFFQSMIKSNLNKEKVKGLTGEEWRLSIPLSISIKFKYISELLLIFGDDGKALGTNLQSNNFINSTYINSPNDLLKLDQISNSSSSINIYYKKMFIARLVSNSLRSLFSTSDDSITYKNHIDPNNKTEYKVQIHLSNFNFKLFDKLKTVLFHLLSKEQYQLLDDIFDKIKVLQHKEELKFKKLISDCKNTEDKLASLFLLACKQYSNQSDVALLSFKQASKNGHFLSGKIVKLLASQSEYENLVKLWNKIKKSSSLVEHIKNFLVKFHKSSIKKFNIFHKDQNQMLDSLLHNIDSYSDSSNTELILGLEKFISTNLNNNSYINAVGFIILQLAANNNLQFVNTKHKKCSIM